MRRRAMTIIAFIALCTFAHPMNTSPTSMINVAGVWQDDTLSYLTFQGKVFDKSNGDPLVFAAIYLIGSNIGTVSNSEGEFIIKVPRIYMQAYIGISSMGYESVRVPVSGLKSTGNDFAMTLNPIIIPEIKVVHQDPVNIIQNALKKIPANYCTEPVMMTSFYRETIKRNRSYVSVSEAVLDAYKSSYTNDLENDRVRVFKGRKSIDKEKLDTVMMKLQGGPFTSFFLDIVKNPGDLLPTDLENVYEYQLVGTVYVDNRPTFIISFDQRSEVELPLYKGKIYIDVDDLSIVAIEFSLSDKYIKDATKYYIVRRPIGMNVSVENAGYIVKYRKIDNKWYLNYVRSELLIRVRWNSKLFRSNYALVSEMAVTDIGRDNVEKFKFRDATKYNDVLIDKVSGFEDPEFWGEYNVIKPEESIEVAIEKLSRKLKRTQGQ
jgi:hypothetical protein